jgi:hypothetical protein
MTHAFWLEGGVRVVGVAHPQVEKDEWVLQEEEWALLAEYLVMWDMMMMMTVVHSSRMSPPPAQ